MRFVIQVQLCHIFAVIELLSHQTVCDVHYLGFSKPCIDLFHSILKVLAHDQKSTLARHGLVQ